ncbi:hypothetical protein [Ulvibacterium sp.]|uniref:hypothetical protein n=1 Tax=Ulvibacterium sp. TaxID=2665914 RepID=UPI003BAB8B78
MKKLSLKKMNLVEGKILEKEQQKTIFGGYGSGDARCLCNHQGLLGGPCDNCHTRCRNAGGWSGECVYV